MNPYESALLLTLKEISQLVSHSHHPGETLANIVRLIQGRFHTDVCSVYLLEEDRGELVLGATVGLKPESVGQVRMRVDEGLTGLVAEKLAPVMVDDAFSHPRFKYFPEAGEDPYHSFLGIPLIEGGMLQGVLVVQTLEPRGYSQNEVRMLTVVGAQLAPLVSEAHLLEQVVAATHAAPGALQDADEALPQSYQGNPLSPGRGAGQAYVINGFTEWLRNLETRGGSTAHELERLLDATDAAREEIARLSQRISDLVGEDHGAILQAQLMILQDSTIEQDVTLCLAEGYSAEGALIRTLDKYVAAFQKLASPIFQERVFDLKDVFRRVLWHLQPRAAVAHPADGKLVLVAHEASVMDLFSVDLARLAAVVVDKGGPQSHAAILARSLGVPMAGGVPEFVARARPGEPLLVDGTAGTVRRAREEDLAPGAPGAVPATPAVQPVPVPAAGAEDRPRVEVNINLLSEVGPAVEQQAPGVGLYRTEFLFLARRTLPTEEEQVGIYTKLLQRLNGRPASIRTFDLRPDKVAHVSSTGPSAHPLDWRLVLESPPIQKLFKDQVRAILRAAAAGPARILVPLILRTEQLDFVLETIDRAREELQREGLEFRARVPVGMMIEVAAVVPLVAAWAEQVDYFALGTNDLVASALGTDRDAPVGASRNDPLHPGVLRLLHSVVEAAHWANRRVTVCGEMAVDPEGCHALAAFGVDALSVPVNQLAATRAALAKPPSESLARQLLDTRRADQARELIREWKKR